MAGLAFGGQIPDAYIQEWMHTLPAVVDSVQVDLSTVAINVTMIVSPNPAAFAASTDSFAAVMAGRRFLPLNWTFTDAEINDPFGFYVQGAPWTIATADVQQLLPGYAAAFYPQPMAFVAHPNQSTWFTPQAASSLNTTRPLLNFPLSRHSHRSGVFLQQLPMQLLPGSWRQEWFSSRHISGGRSGAIFYNDWIDTQPFSCLPPVDPSFSDVLGPVVMLPWTLPPDEDGNPFGTLHGVGMELEVDCQPGYHLEPPALAGETSLACMPSGMWMDPKSLTFRRCVRDQLSCAFPLHNSGAIHCEPVPPIITELRASRGRQGDNVTLLDVLTGEVVVLSIYGNAFFLPLSVTVGGVECVDAQLRSTPGYEVADVNFNVSSADGVALMRGTYGGLIVCTLPTIVGRSVVLVVSGMLVVVARVSPSTGATYATVSSSAPAIVGIYADESDCYRQNSTKTPQLELMLYGCPIRKSFSVTVCASVDSVGSYAFTHPGLALFEAYVETRLHCEADISLETYQQTCATCTVYPRLSVTQLYLVPTMGERLGEVTALLYFRQCPLGTSIAYNKSQSGNATDLCRECPVGTSSDGNQAAQDCEPCSPGSFANETGLANCFPCPAGTFSSGLNNVNCTVCPINSYANSTQRTSCETCELNQFIVYAAAADRGIVGECTPCPNGATCLRNGTIVAGTASYVLIDQDWGTLDSVWCQSSACLDGFVCTSSPSSPTAEVVARSQLGVVNCCGAGRWPAYVDDPTEYVEVEEMVATAGRNVLCAKCLPGYSSVNGHCIFCSSTNYGAVFGILCLSLFLVYLLHRGPHDWTGAATLLIVSNFLQLSSLFVANEAIPQIANLINLNPWDDYTGNGQVADGRTEPRGHELYAGLCIMPMDDPDRVLGALVSPIIAVVMLAFIALLHAGLWRCLHRSDAAFGSPRVRRVYMWLCAASTPRRSLSSSTSMPLEASLLSPVSDQSRVVVDDSAACGGDPLVLDLLSAQPRAAVSAELHRPHHHHVGLLPLAASGGVRLPPV